MSGSRDTAMAAWGDAAEDEVRVSRLTGDGLRARLDDVAALRVALARAWPELRETDRAAEKAAVARIAARPGGIVLGAFAGDRTVGMALGAAVARGSAVAAALDAAGIDPDGAFELLGSFVVPPWRGRGIGGRLLAMREAAAREAGRVHACACEVVRGVHPRRPARTRDPSDRWRRQGYVPVGTMQAAWREVGRHDASPQGIEIFVKGLQ